MMRFPQTFLALALCFLLVFGAQGATIHYVESTDGDLPTNPDFFNPLTLDIGINTVSGGYSAATDSDGDAFAFEIAIGHQLTSIWLDYAWTGSGQAWRSWNLNPWNESQFLPVPRTGNDAYCNPRPGVCDLSPVFPWVSDLPLGSDIYGLSSGDGVWQDAAGTYIWQFEVVAVPIPAAIWLFGSALGLLGWMRRKKA
jgi:hypothetical protein